MDYPTSQIACWSAALACWLAVAPVRKPPNRRRPNNALRSAARAKGRGDRHARGRRHGQVHDQGRKDRQTRAGWSAIRRAQILRRFLDTNGDNDVDQWCYYKDGVEVYRDIDTNFNHKADQCRWLNTAGSRWGIDANEDKKIDYWKTISAEEVTAELVAAMRDRDRARFERDAAAPARNSKHWAWARPRPTNWPRRSSWRPANFAKLAGQQKLIAPDTKWVSFAGNQPGIVPAGTDDSTADVMVYENVVAMVETDGKAQAITRGHAGAGRQRLAADRRAADCKTTHGRGRAPAVLLCGARSEQQARAAGEPGPTTKLASCWKNTTSWATCRPIARRQQHDKRVELLEQLATEADAELRPQWYQPVGRHAQRGGANRQLSGRHRQAAGHCTTSSRPIRRTKSWHSTLQYRLDDGRAQPPPCRDPMVDFAKIQTKWVEDLEKFVDGSQEVSRLGRRDAGTGHVPGIRWAGRQGPAVVRDHRQGLSAGRPSTARPRAPSCG